MALNPSTQLTQFGHTAWRVRDGLIPGPPTSLTQAADGFLWIGTEAGLVRFDGVRFVPWSPPEGMRLPDDRIVALLSAKDGSVWIGTGNGLAQWKDGKLIVHARVGRFGALLEDRDGVVWAGHTRALSELPPLCRSAADGFRCFGSSDSLPLHFVSALHQDGNGDLWIGGDSGVCRWRSGKPDCHAIPGMADSGNKFGVFAIADDAGGGLWAGTGMLGIWRLAADRWTRYSDASSPGVNSDSMLADRRGTLWIGTRSQGLLRLVGGRTEHFTRADGLSGDIVTGLFEDREGNVWVGTGSGLDRFRDVKVSTVTAREGLPGTGTIVSVAAAGDGGVWIADTRALIRFEHGAVLASWGAGRELPGSGPTSLLEDSRGRLWVGIDNGLAWRERDRFPKVRTQDGSALGVVTSMTEDRNGDLWVATIDPAHALVRVREDRVVETLSVERLGGQHVAAILADPGGGVWIALNNSKLEFYKDGRLESRSPAIPGSNWIRGLLLDSRGLWEVTNRGLGRFRNGGLDVLDAAAGLPCNDIESANRGDDGSLWLKTACGLVHITPEAVDSWSENPERRIEVRVFDAVDGDQSGLSPFTPRSARSQDGRLWFAVELGLQVLDPKNLNENAMAPPVQVVRVIADRTTYPVGSELRLPPRTGDVEIGYTALSLTAPEKVRFRYRLEGTDQDWHEVGNRREAFYSNLKPGHYRFRVVACNNDGVWNREGATFAFSIRPAFYQTYGFLGSCIVAIGGLVWAGYRLRVRQIQASLDRRFEERLAERGRIARELHDTLLQGFISASMQLHVVRDQLPADSPDAPRLNRVLELMGRVIEEGRNAVRGLRAPGGDPDDLETAFSRIAQELNVEDKARFRVIGEGHARRLRAAIRDEVYRIVREAVVNAFHHARAGVIEVEVEFAPSLVRILVRDDGVGIDPEVLESGREGHWGLPGMRERAERIGGTLRVWSRAGAGTEVELSVPARIAFGEN
jgi:signal transduction histidine kinase/ligand-binding sensor domain-containing protein